MSIIADLDASNNSLLYNGVLAGKKDMDSCARANIFNIQEQPQENNTMYSTTSKRCVSQGSTHVPEKPVQSQQIKHRPQAIINGYTTVMNKRRNQQK